MFCNCALPDERFELPPQRMAIPAHAMPILHSLPNAAAKLYLSFNGMTVPYWGLHSNVVTPPFDYVDDVGAVSEIWSRIAEDYAPFNIDVTTENPGNLTDKVTACVSIGGAYTDWYGNAAGGAAYINGFSSSTSNIAFVFSRSLGNNAKYIAEAASHEAGHLFGLQHQAQWDGETLLSQYNRGDANWAPIMGVGYYAASTTWTVGRTSSGSIQDDLEILSNQSNGFGIKPDQPTAMPTTITYDDTTVRITRDGKPDAIYDLRTGPPPADQPLQTLGPDSHGIVWRRYADLRITWNDQSSNGGLTSQNMILVGEEISVVGIDGFTYRWNYSTHKWFRA